MAWEKLDTDTLTGDASSAQITFTAKKFIQVMGHLIPAAVNTIGSIFYKGDTTSSNLVARRRSSNGATDATDVNTDGVSISTVDGQANIFAIQYISNISGEEKLIISNSVIATVIGATTPPERLEEVGKHSTTSGQIAQIDMLDESEGGDEIGTDSNLSALGTD